MPLFRVQVFMQKGTDRPWTNVWHVDAADLASASAAAVGTLAPGYAPLLNSAVTLTRIVTSTPGSPGAFIETFPGIVGSSGAGGDLMPLFNTIRFLFDVGSGRPDSKFWRGLLTEGITADGLIPSATIATFVSLLTSLLGDMNVAGAPLCDTALHPYTVVSGQLPVQERQRHRRRRRAP